MLTVEKIGGTSMSQFDYVLEHVIKGKRKGAELYNRVFVVSAYADVTNWLLEHKKTKQPGIYTLFYEGKDYQKAAEELLEKLKAINRNLVPIGLNLQLADAFIEDRMRLVLSYLKSMSHVYASGYVNRKEILLAAREMLASIGESHSAYNSADILTNNGIQAICLDLSGLEDDQMLTIDERIADTFKNIEFAKNVIIATGYTKGTEGIMREFDRGYSEVTFSKIAVCLKAEEAIIHKEFHLSSADPKIVGESEAKIVGFTNFDVADQLADVGMEAIHPKASKPLEINGINLRVKNAFDPKHPGTLISKDYRSKEAKIEIIAGSTKVTAVEIHDPLMVGAVGFDLHVMELFAKYNISYILKTTNANSITQLIWENEKNCALLLAELKQKYELVTTTEAAIVCAIGSNMTKPGFLEKATAVLADNNINILCVAQSMRQVNMQFVIDRKDYNQAVIALNHALCQ